LNNLKSLFLDGNRISDISPLLTNSGIASGDEIRLQWNPLSAASYSDHLTQLKARGVLGLDNIAAPQVTEPPAAPPAPEAAPEIPAGPRPEIAPDSSEGTPPYFLWVAVAAILLVAGLFYTGYRRPRRGYHR